MEGLTHIQIRSKETSVHLLFENKPHWSFHKPNQMVLAPRLHQNYIDLVNQDKLAGPEPLHVTQRLKEKA